MDNKAQFTVLVERCVMQINPDPFFDNSTFANIRKLFRYVFQEPWRNEETIAALTEYLPAKVEAAAKQWRTASDTYRNEYIDTKFRHELTAQQKRKIEVENRRKYAEVKRCKAKFERYTKILGFFETLKTKNS